MARVRKNTENQQNPATEETKAQSQPTEEREEKDMEQKKNTTPATSTPAQTKSKPAESKQRKNQQNPASKDTKSKTPAEKKSKKKSKKAEGEQKKARIENNEIIVEVVKQTVKVDSITTTLTEKKIPFPKNAKAEYIDSLATLVQCNTLKVSKEKFAGELAKIKAKKGEPLTDEQKNQQKLVKAKINLCTKQLALYGIDNEEKLKIFYNEKNAEMLASYVLNTDLSVELCNFKKALKEMHNTLDDVLDRYLSKKTIKMTEEEEKVFAELKKALKEDLAPYTKGSMYFDEFHLSISNKDIIKWYKECQLDIESETFIYDDKKTKALTRAVVKWYLTKLKVIPKEETNK